VKAVVRYVVGALLVASCAEPTKTTVRISVPGSPPRLVVFKDGSGAWQQATELGASEFHIEVTNDYEVVSVCDDLVNGGTLTVELAATIADGLDRSMVWECAEPPDEPSPGSPVHVTGTVMQPGTVVLGASVAKSNLATWSYDLPVEPRTYTLLAVGTDQAAQIAIRRGIVVTADTALPPVDFGKEGIPLATPQIALKGVPPIALIDARSYMSSPSGGAQLWDLSTGTTPQTLTPRSVPPEALEADERNYLDVTASYDHVTAMSSFRLGNASFEARMMVAPKVTLDRTRAFAGTFTTVDEYARAFAFVSPMCPGACPPSPHRIVTATKSWLDASGSIFFDESVEAEGAPALDLSQPLYRSLTLDRGDETASHSVTIDL
jgi:hypothetical protein